MSILEAFKLALQSLWGNKMRSILTLIGVVMGVASVIMVITLVKGAKRYVSTKLSGYGADVFTVTRMSSVILSADEYFQYQKRKIIRIEDYEAIKDGCDDCSEVGASLFKNTNVVYNGHSSNNTGVRGYTWTMMSLNNIDIALGRGFTPADEEHATIDVIVGYDIVDNLLGDGDPIGKEIRVDGIPYTIIGVGDRQGKTLGQSQDNWVAIPITHLSADLRLQRLGGHLCARRRRRAGHGARRGPGARASCARGATTRPAQPDDFEIETNDTFLDIWKQISWASSPGWCWGWLHRAGGGRRGDHEHHAGQRHRAHARDRRAQGAGRQAARRADAVPDRERVTGLVGGVFGILWGVLVGKLITVFVGFPTAVPVWAIFLGLFPGQRRRHFLRRVPGQQSRKTRSGGGVESGNVEEPASSC